MSPGERLLYRGRIDGCTVVVVGHGAGLCGAGSEALRVLGEVYARAPLRQEYVELHLYPDMDSVARALAGEASGAGVAVTAVYDVSHDAWHGYPRVHISCDSLERLGERLFRALAAHEAVHTLLHGSLEYYTVPLAAQPLASYIAATVLKDLEVHLYMAAMGLVGEVEALVRYWGETGCTRVEEYHDWLRRCTGQAALGRGCGSCQGASKASSIVESLARGWRRWRRLWSTSLVARLAEAVEEDLSSLGLG